MNKQGAEYHYYSGEKAEVSNAFVCRWNGYAVDAVKD